MAQVPDLRERTRELAGLEAQITSTAIPVLREARSTRLRQAIVDFHSNLAGYNEPLATEFRAATNTWLAIADQATGAAQEHAAATVVPQLFRAGDPVQRETEAFVSRDDVVGEIAHEIELATGCPGIVLYGRRRVGKSTVLCNLQGFLPEHVRVVYISLQRADAFSSLRYFVETVTTEIDAGVGDGARLTTTAHDLPTFAAALKALNTRLANRHRKALVCLDEYENLDVKLGEGVFPHDLLATLRDSIQFDRNLIWLFAGSHQIDDLPHGDWTSRLVSARTVEVPNFTPGEVRTLLTDPMHHSRAWAQSSNHRPRLTGFWGDEYIERVHREAGGWPHLVQLIAQDAVTLANRKKQPKMDDALFEQTLAVSVVAGHNVLRELIFKESTSRAEWEYLRRFAHATEQAMPYDDRVRRALLRRRLIVMQDKIARLTAPIMARWLRERGDVEWEPTAAAVSG